MAAFASLTADQQRVIKEDLRNARGALGAFARALQDMADMDSNWVAQTLAIANAIDTGTIIPDENGLAGAAPLTVDEYKTIWTAIQTMLSTNNTAARRQTYAKFAGPLNISG